MKRNKPQYSAEWNLPDSYRGDTMTPYRLTVDRDLTGYDIRMDLRGGYMAAAVKQFRMGEGITPENLAAGMFVIDAWRIELPVGRYAFDIEFTKPDGERRTWVHGTLRVVDDKTK